MLGEHLIGEQRATLAHRGAERRGVDAAFARDLAEHVGIGDGAVLGEVGVEQHHAERGQPVRGELTHHLRRDRGRDAVRGRRLVAPGAEVAAWLVRARARRRSPQLRVFPEAVEVPGAGRGPQHVAAPLHGDVLAVLRLEVGHPERGHVAPGAQEVRPHGEADRHVHGIQPYWRVATSSSSDAHATSSSESTTRSAALRSSPAVRRFGTHTHARPAALAELMPCGESSNATQSAGSTPRRARDRAVDTRFGLRTEAEVRAVPRGDRREVVLDLELGQERLHPVGAAARRDGAAHAPGASFVDEPHDAGQQRELGAHRVLDGGHEHAQLGIGRAGATGLRLEQHTPVDGAPRADREREVVDGQLRTVVGEHPPPRGEQRPFRVDDEAVEVEDECCGDQERTFSWVPGSSGRHFSASPGVGDLSRGRAARRWPS